MAKLPLNIALMPYAQQRRQILQQLLGAQSGVDPSATMYTSPNVGITATNAGGTQTSGQMPFQVPYMRQQGGGMPQTLPNTLYDRATRGLGGIEGFRERQQQTPPTSAPQSMLAKIRSGLGASPTSPMGMALDSAAQSLLQQSGYSQVPRTTGQIFGEALGAAREGYMGGKALEQAEADRLMAQRLADRDYALGLAKLAAEQGKRSAFSQKMADLGIDLNTPEGQAEARRIVESSGKTDIDISQKGEETFVTESVKAGFKRLGEADKIVQDSSQVEARLEMAVNLLNNPDFETGRLTSLLSPVKEFLVESKFIGGEEAKVISDQEVFKSLAEYLIPQMRASGSGSTSDSEMAGFRKATVGLSKTTEGNMKIAIGMLQAIRFEKKKRNLMDEYMLMDVDADGKSKPKGSLLKFGKYVDQKLGSVIPEFKTDEEIDQAYADGRIGLNELYYDANSKKYLVFEEENISR